MHTHRTLPLLAVVFVVGCTHAEKKQTVQLDQSSPQAGLRAYLEALRSGDAAMLRQTVFVLPRRQRARDDMADYQAAASRLQRTFDAHFPGQSLGIDVAHGISFSNDALEYIANAKVSSEGDKAIVTFQPHEGRPKPGIDDQSFALRRDRGKWKLDMEAGDAGEVLDYYPERARERGVNLGYLVLFHEMTPGLSQLSADIESRKVSKIEEVQSRAKAAVDAAFNKTVYNQGTRGAN